MHLCLTVECITSGLHLSVFQLGHTPPTLWRERVQRKGSEWRSASRRHQLQTRTTHHGVMPNPAQRSAGFLKGVGGTFKS